MPRSKPQIHPNPTLFVLNRKQDPEALQRQRTTPSQLEKKEDIILYGEGNALPLKIAKLVSESPATSACISTISKYIKGAKFTDESLMNLKIDRNGTTLWDLHSILCDTIALFDGFAVNFKFDGGGKITYVYPLSFESTRLKKPDSEGYIGGVNYNPYYGTTEYKQEYTTEYPIFDPKQVLNQQAEKGTDYDGQVFYYGKTTPIYRFYPVPDYWSAKKWIEIDARIQEFHAENLDNGFFQSVLINVIGDPSKPSSNPAYQSEYTDSQGVKRKKPTKTVGEEFNEMMSQTFSGANKAGTALVMWSGNADTAVKVQPFQTNSNADLFTALQDLTTKNITIATQVPGILANISEGVNLGSTGNEMQKAVELMQSRVVEKQNLLMNFYNQVLLPNLAQQTTARVDIVNFTPVSVPVEINDKVWEVLTTEEKREFIRKNVSGVDLMPTAPATTTTTGEPIQAQPEVNDALKNVNLQQLDRIQKIVKRFNRAQIDPDDPKGLTFEQAKQMLMAFGFTDEQINAWLITNDEE